MDFCVEWLPDIIVRIGLRIILFFARQKISPDELDTVKQECINNLKQTIDKPAEDLDEGPYELPTSFFESFLGPQMKYSACYFEGDSLDVAENKSLEMYCTNSQLKNGMKVLDLGCGLGSLSLYIARHYPDCVITAVSNSAKQSAFVKNKAALESIDNLMVIYADLCTFEPDTK